MGRQAFCWGAAPQRSAGNCAGAVRRQSPPSPIARSLAVVGIGRAASAADGGWLHDFERVKLIQLRWSPAQIACKLRVEPVVRHWFENP